MKTIKTLLIIVLGIFCTQIGWAQSGMMDPVSFKLKNGVTVVVAQNQTASKIFSNFNIESESPVKSKPGVEQLLTAILNENAAKNTNVTFSEKGGNVAALTSDFEKSLESLSALIQQPAIDQDIFDKQKIKLISSIKAKDRYYPEDLTEETANILTLNDVKEFYASTVLPSKAFLTIAGDITPSDAKVLAKKTFGKWEAAASAGNSK